MIGTDIMLDAFSRVHESLHRTLGDVTSEELLKEPHPSIGWLAWRISRVMDANVSRLSGREQLWIGEECAARFGMPAEPEDYGRSARHTREQVKSFRASAQQLLDYHDTAYERMKVYLSSLSADELARELDEPQYDPRPNCSCALGQRFGKCHDQRGADQLFESLPPPRRLVPARGQGSSERPLALAGSHVDNETEKALNVEI